MKNQIKKIGSLLAACAVMSSTFAGSVFAAENEDAPAVVDSTREYLLQEDFSNFQNGGDFENDRIDKWRVEGGKDGWNGDLSTAELDVEDIAGMEKALVLKNTNNIIRGGKGWTEDKWVQPGENVNVEFDVYAQDNSEFAFSLISKEIANVDDADGTSAVFVIKSNDGSKVYRNWCQGYGDINQMTNLNFKRNAVNHVKINYTLNEDVSYGTFDKMVITISNEDGLTTQTINGKDHGSAVNFRFAQNNKKPLTAIKGIHIFKSENTSQVYLDNIEVYKDSILLEDDFTILKNGGDDDDNNRLDQWRIEGGTNWNGYLGINYLTVEDKSTMQSALKMGGQGFPADGIIRGGRLFNSTVEAGQSFTTEMDIYAENGAVFSFGMVLEEQTWKAEDAAVNAYLFHLNKATEKQNKLYIYSDQGMNNAASIEVPNVVFKRDAVNHIKIDYDINEDVSYGTHDTMTITVTNEDGTTSGTVRPNYRYKGSVKPLTGVKGFSMFKWDQNTDTAVYIDNLKAYRTDIEYSIPTASSQTSDSVTVNFGKAVNDITDGTIYIFSNGTKIDATAALSEDKMTYTLSGASLTAGKEYQVIVAAGVNAADGSIIKPSTLTFVPGNDNTTVTKDQETINPATDLKISITPATSIVGKSAIVCVASYDAQEKLVGVKMQKGTLTASTKTFTFAKDTITAANSYKVFVWDAESGEPLCNNL